MSGAVFFEPALDVMALMAIALIAGGVVGGILIGRADRRRAGVRRHPAGYR